MPEIHRSAIVPYSPDQMFELVRDVVRYPQFLGWVRTAEVHKDDSREQLATLEVQLGGLVQRFTTRNRLEPPEVLTMQLDRGPFDELSGQWRFQPIGTGCRASLDLTFRMRGSVLLAPFKRNFARMADRMVDDFSRRADALYGERRGEE